MNRLKATLYALYIIFTKKDWTLSSFNKDAWYYASSKGKKYSHAIRVCTTEELKEAVIKARNGKTNNRTNTPSNTDVR